LYISLEEVNFEKKYLIFVVHYKITGITSCSNATNSFIYTVNVVNEVESVELSLYCTSEE